MTQGEIFNPADWGFNYKAPIQKTKAPAGCSVRLATSKGRNRCSLNLDAETTGKVVELLGDRVSVCVDQEGNVMVFRGDGFSVGVHKRGTSRVTIDGLATDLSRHLSDGDSPYERVWTSPQMVILKRL